jgi:SNF2 family DNA or RNA helicase
VKYPSDFVKLAKLDPLPHQERFKTRFVEQKGPHRGMLAKHDTGTGKTFSSIFAAHGTGKPVVAIVPASLRDNYKKELKASGLDMPAEVYSYNEALRLRRDPKFVDSLQDKVVVYDEGQRMGGVGSETSKLPQTIKGSKTMVFCL